MVRILIGVVGPRGLRWVLRFADDFLMLFRSGAISRPLVQVAACGRNGPATSWISSLRSWASATAGAIGQLGGAARKHRGRSRSRPSARA